MAVTRKCAAGRNRGAVKLDVIRKDEFLRFRICVTRGAKNDARIVDDDGRIILSGSHRVSTKCRQRDWPAEGETVATSEHFMAIVLVFVRAIEYSVQVTLHHADGTLKQWVKDCTYTRQSETDKEAVGLLAFVEREA